ncbi:hypothetical protein OG585_55020 (plasmid) [Streptomyces sp. NBC_01340]|nr:hypothetical protein OG585_00465 [Streptomyces sp. NBC_01340]WSI43867.1 hypothetical protein OG585_46455 [Streptomyces sp. NBC_01340]WSI45805.1 hypothetical protein OG585_55020 [Streptomyces sp. NBC_01340]
MSYVRASERSVEGRRRAWRGDGTAALASAGLPKLPGLSDDQFAEPEPEQELALGAFTVFRGRGRVSR